MKGTTMKGKKHKLVCTLVRDEFNVHPKPYSICPRGMKRKIILGLANDSIADFCEDEFESIFPGLKLEPGEAVDITITITEDE